MFDRVPQADHVEAAVAEVVSQKIAVDDLEPERILRVTRAVRADVDADDVETVPYEFKEESISAADLEETMVTSRI